jgi:hypothetical protein
MLFLSFLPFPAWSANDSIGSLRQVQGDVIYITTEGKQQAKNGLHVYQGDSLKTTQNGSVGIIFKDNSRISLGPNSELKLTEYIYKPAQKKFSMLNKLSRGTASYLSGKMSKLSPGSVRFKTPDATIGARGTSLLIEVEGD